MEIIRDKDGDGLMMIPILIDWGIRRCNYKSCREKPNTIIAMQDGKTPVFGLCESHFQSCNVLAGGILKLEWNKFDAFAANGGNA